MYWYNMATGKSVKIRPDGAPSIEEYEGTLGAAGSAEGSNNDGESEDGEGDSRSGARGLLIKADEGEDDVESRASTPSFDDEFAKEAKALEAADALTLKIEVQLRHSFFSSK